MMGGGREEGGVGQRSVLVRLVLERRRPMRRVLGGGDDERIALPDRRRGELLSLLRDVRLRLDTSGSGDLLRLLDRKSVV